MKAPPLTSLNDRISRGTALVLAHVAVAATTGLTTVTGSRDGRALASEVAEVHLFRDTSSA